MKKNAKALIFGVAVFCFMTLGVPETHAAPPQTISYQGFLTSAAGVPQNGVHTALFSLYSAPTGGAPLWSESQSVTAVNGVYNVMLGSTPAGGAALSSLPFDVPYWLGVNVNADGEMTPRAALAIVPYAYRAVNADTATSAATATTAGSAATVSGTVAGSQITGSISASQISGAISNATISGATLSQLQGSFIGTLQPIASGANVVTTVDSSGSVGLYNSIAIGADGNPVISYWNGSASDLKVTKCGNSACSAGNTVSTLDSLGAVGLYSSITIGTDGLPAISYQDATNGDLKVAKCGNAACSSGNALTAIDTIGSVGSHSSITIGADGLPVISYYDTTNQDLKVAKCGNAACTAGNTTIAVDTTGNVGQFTSITIGADGFPLISYLDSTNGALKVAKCGNAACSSGNVITELDTASNAGWYSSIAIGADGLPTILYVENSAGTLRLARCGNASCSAGNSNNAVNLGGTYGLGALAVGIDGMPAIALIAGVNEELRLVRCADLACTGASSVAPVDGSPTLRSPSIAIGADGMPVIAYYDQVNFDLKVAKCANAFCSPYFRRR